MWNTQNKYKAYITRNSKDQEYYFYVREGKKVIKDTEIIVESFFSVPKICLACQGADHFGVDLIRALDRMKQKSFATASL